MYLYCERCGDKLIMPVSDIGLAICDSCNEHIKQWGVMAGRIQLRRDPSRFREYCKALAISDPIRDRAKRIRASMRNRCNKEGIFFDREVLTVDYIESLRLMQPESPPSLLMG